MKNSQIKKRKLDQKRKYLLFVRAGDDSQHRNWYPLSNERNWDLCISCYGTITPDDHKNADCILQGGLSKWTDFSENYYHVNAELNGYEYVLLLDDDISIDDLSDIDELFDISKKLQLSVSQASLSSDSFFSWRITLNHPGALFRYTNFVECMCPVLSAEALKELETFISNSVSGQGLDMIFWNALGQKQTSMAIIDLIQMHHKKPIDQSGGAFYQHLRDNGVNVTQEVAKFLQLFDQKCFEAKTLDFVPRPQRVESMNV